jgi:hypothetical protein
MDNFDALGPAVVPVPYKGGTIEVLPVEVGNIPAIIRQARPIIDSILALDDAPDASKEDELVGLALDMLDKHGDAVFEAMALIVGHDVAVIRKGNIGEFVVLAKAVFEVNRDFFRDHLAPLLAKARAQAASLPTGAGKTRSSS